MKHISFSTLTRLTDLLEEVRRATDLIGIRPINEYVDGVVKASGKFECFCWHCSTEPASDPAQLKHQPECLMARIDAALAEAKRSLPQNE